MGTAKVTDIIDEKRWADRMAHFFNNILYNLSYLILNNVAHK